jgi:hypothetical protein
MQVSGGTRRVPAQTYVARGTGGGLRVVLSDSFQPCIHMEAPSQRCSCRVVLPRHELSVQAFEPVLALSHPAPVNRCGMETIN